MLEAMLMTNSRPGAGSGQVEWKTPGTYQWVCPEGVTEVSVLLVGCGQPGYTVFTNAFGGRGGGTRWKNKVPVTPGQVYTIEVASGGDGVKYFSSTDAIAQIPVASLPKTTALGLVAGTSTEGTTLVQSATSGGGYGGLYDPTGYNKLNLGGCVGTLFGEGGDGSSAFRSMGLNVTTGVLVARTGSFGMDAGGGGAAIPKAVNGGTLNGRWLGGHGAARIIWGTGRAYPSTRITDE